VCALDGSISSLSEPHGNTWLYHLEFKARKKIVLRLGYDCSFFDLNSPIGREDIDSILMVFNFEGSSHISHGQALIPTRITMNLNDVMIPSAQDKCCATPNTD